jgi:hypothetical protein
MPRPNRLQLALGVASLALCAGPALAAMLPPANSGSIAVYVPGATTGSASTQPQYQGYVGFNTTGTSKLKNPRVWVACYQNGTLVYGEGGSPGRTVKLGGDSSQWVANGGGAATCTADLYYIVNANGTAEWNGKGAQGGTVYLAHTSFTAAG